jgi:hypothetical protein
MSDADNNRRENNMRTVRLKVYQFNELSKEAQEFALGEQTKFEVMAMTEESPFYGAVLEMEKMQTPWFLEQTIFHEYREQLIDAIESNEYEFYQNGRFYVKSVSA